MNVTVFEAINITKKYRNTLALNQVSMSVMQGDIYGFIGENSAGKTTMIRLLTGLAEPTTGKIALFGESNKKLAKQRDRIGCIIESPSLYLDMTAYENLEVQRLQRGIPGKGCIDNALALVGLKDTGKKKAKDFSLGMRQRLALAIALLGNPEFLVLDEPINGLDPTGIMVSFALGDMTFFGAGDGTESVIGFQAKCYLSSEIPTFQTVARSSLAYTAFFWIQNCWNAFM